MRDKNLFPNLKFLEFEYFLSRMQKAFFTAAVVAFSLGINYHFFGLFSVVFLVSARSITNLNFQGNFRGRLSLALKTLVIFSISAFLGSMFRQTNFFFDILIVFLLAFNFAFWRQIFPHNWTSIIIPTAILFFVNFARPSVLQTFLGASLGFTFEFFLGLTIYFKRRYLCEEPIKITPLPPPQTSDSKLIFGLYNFNFLYFIELGFLLSLGVALINFTSYPHAYWMPLTCVMVLKIGKHGTLKRVSQRILGTLIACLFGSLIWYLHFNLFILDIMITSCVFIWLAVPPDFYTTQTVFTTLFLILLMGSSHNFSFPIVVERIVFTLLGGLATLFSSIFFLKKERLV